MDEIRTFQGGMNTDINISNQPPNTYRSALNVVQISESGDIGGLINEKGFARGAMGLPENFVLVGETVLGDDIIVFLSHEQGYSQIGVIDKYNNYTRVVPGADGDDTNTELNFTNGNPIDATARKLFTGERVVYFTDNLNPMRFVNIDNPPPVGSIDDNTGVIPEQSLPLIVLRDIDETTGNLRVGMYHFITRYLNADLTPTSYSIPSAGIPMVENTRAGGSFQYDGEYQDFGKVNKTIVLDVSNIDLSYPYIQLIVVYYEGITNTLTSEALPITNITGESMRFLYSGAEENVTDITLEELRVIPVSYSTAKAVVQKDDTLFWSNLKDMSLQFDNELQRLANDCTVRYDITEVPYTDRLGEASPFFTLAVNPSFKGEETDPEYRTIVLALTAPADPTAAVDPAYYSAHFAGLTATGAVTVTT